MKFWFKALLVFIIQEYFLTNIVIKTAYDENRNICILTGVFIFASIFNIFLGYNLGKFIQTKGERTKLIFWAKKYISKFDGYIGKFGERVFLCFLALTFPPYIPAFLSSWLKLKFKEIFIIILIGDSLWYLTIWLLIIGISHIVKNSQMVLYIILGLTLFIIILKNIITKKIMLNNSKKDNV